MPRSSNTSKGHQFPRFFGLILGFVAGAGLMYLWMSVPSTPDKITPELPQQIEEMKLDFYTIFPKSEVPILEDYETKGENVTNEEFAYILQAGSFQSPEDAEEKRVELILTGFVDAFVREVEVDGTTWHRVIVGKPYSDQGALSQAQEQLDQAQIEAIPFRVRR